MLVLLDSLLDSVSLNWSIAIRVSVLLQVFSSLGIKLLQLFGFLCDVLTNLGLDLIVLLFELFQPTAHLCGFLWFIADLFLFSLIKLFLFSFPIQVDVIKVNLLIRVVLLIIWLFLLVLFFVYDVGFLSELCHLPCNFFSSLEFVIFFFESIVTTFNLSGNLG